MTALAGTTVTPTAARAHTTLPWFAFGIRVLAAMTVSTVVASCSESTAGTAHPAHSSTSTSTAAPVPRIAPPAPSASSEDQAKAAVTAFQDAYNTQDWDRYRDQMCTAMRNEFDSGAMGSLKQGRAANGPTTITSMTVTVDGDTATATINAASPTLGTGTITLPLKREHGWKVCKV